LSGHVAGRLPDATRYNLPYPSSSSGCGHKFRSACGFLLGPGIAQANGAAEHGLSRF
jgi:hypothetical protein